MSETINTTNFDKVYKKLQTSGYKGTQEDLVSFIQKPEGLTKVYNKLSNIGYKGTAQDLSSYLTQPTQLGDFPAPQTQKAAPPTALDDLFNTYFKQFGGVDKNDTENYNNLQAIEKASAKVQEVQSKIKTTEDLNLYAQADIENQKVNVLRYKELESQVAPDIVTSPSTFDSKQVTEEKQKQREFKSAVETNVKSQEEDLKNIQETWQSLMEERVGVGYQPDILQNPPQITAKFLFDSAIDVYNVGDFKKQRSLKTLYNYQPDESLNFLKSPEDVNVGLTQATRSVNIFKGAEIQKKSLDFAIETEKQKQDYLKQVITDFNNQIGNNPPNEKQKEYFDNLNKELQNSINNQLGYTNLKNEVDIIQKQEGANFEVYKNAKEITQERNSLNDWLGSPIRDFVDKIGVNIVESASKFIPSVKGSLTGASDDELLLYNITQQSIIDNSISNIAKTLPAIAPTASFDDESYKKETLTYIDENGNRKWNLSQIAPTAISTYFQSMLMGTGGASLGTLTTKPILQKGLQATGMYLPTTVLFGGDIYQGYVDRGIPPSKAQLMTGLSLMLETASELINPIEMQMAKGADYDLINLSQSQVGKQFYRDASRLITGGAKYDKLIDFLTSSKRFTGEVAKQIGLEYVEELTAAIGGYIQESAYKSFTDPTFEVNNEVTLQDQITTFVTTAVGMSLMGGYQGFNKLKEYNKSAAYYVSKNPEIYLEQLKQDVETGKISQDKANVIIQSIANADGTNVLLKDKFDKIDNLIYKSGKPVEDELKEQMKYDLFKKGYDVNTLKSLVVQEKDEKTKEELVEKIDEYLLDFQKDIQNTEVPKELTELEKLNTYLNSEFSEQYVNNLGVPSTIKDIITLLQNKLNQVQEDLKPIIQDKINLLENKLKDLNTIVDTTPLTEEDYNHYAKILLDEDIINQAEYDQFTPEELKTKVDEYITKQNEELSEFNVDLEDIQTIEDPEERLQKAIEYKEELYKQPKKDKQKELISSYIDGLEPLVEQIKTEKSLKERELPISFNESPLYKENYVVIKDNSIWKIEDFEDDRLKLSSKEGQTTLTKNLSDLSDVIEQLSPEEAFSRFKELTRKKQEARIKELESKANLTTEELKELQSLTLQNPVIEELEEETTTEDENKLNEELRDFENGQKALNPLRTQVLGKKPIPLSVEERWYNFLFFLRDLQNKNPFKTFKELGYTVSIVSQTEIPFEQLPQDTKTHITKAFNNSSQKDFNTFYQEYSKDYKVLIITDQEGKPILKDGQYLLSFLYNVVEKNGKYRFDSSTVTVPTEEQLTKNGLDEEWFQNQLKALYNLKRATENQTFNIISISKGILEDKSTEFKNTSFLTKNPEITLSITGAIQNKPAKKGTAYIDINGTQYLLYRNSLPQDLVDTIWILSQPNPSKSNLGIYSTLPSELHDFYDRVSYIKSLIYIGDQLKTKEGNIRNGLILDKETKKWYLDGVQINTKEELSQILSNKRINIDKNTLLNSQPYPIISFSNNTFTTKYTTYPKFISENTQVKYLLGDESRINPYIEFSASPEPLVQFATQKEMQEVFGVTIEKTPTSDLDAKYDAELPALGQEQKPVEQKPTIETSINNETLDKEVKKPTIKRVQRNVKKGLEDNNTLSKLKIIDNKATPEQIQKAKEWFETSPLSKHVNFQEFFDIVNSDAYADWSLSGIRLFKGANYTDLYHESWHEFSQLYLTPKQRTNLYNEVRNKVATITLPNGTKISTKKATDFQIEEYISEDFRKYVLSDGKNILDGRYQRNSLFRRILNFLKELFTSNNTLDVVYERLYTGQLNKYKRNLNNSAFNILQKNVGNNERTLDYKEQREVFSNIDAVMAAELANKNFPPSVLFEKDSKYLTLAYNTVYNQMVLQLKELDKLPDEELEKLADIYNDLAFLTEEDVWNQVVQKHKSESDFLKLGNVQIQLEDQESEKINKFDNNEQTNEESTSSNLKDTIASLNGNEISSKDKANKETIFIVGTLPKYDKNSNPVKSRLFPNYEYAELLDFTTAWNTLSGTLQGITSPLQQHQLIKELSKKKPSFKHVLERVPLISDKELTPEQLKTHIAFVQDLSKPLVRMYEVLLQNNKDGITVNTYPSSITSITNVITEFNNNFQEKPSKFKKLNPKTQLLELDLQAIFPYFEKVNQSKELRIEFLEILGVQYSEDALKSKDYEDLINNKFPDDVLYYIYNYLKELQPYLAKRPDIDLSKPFTLIGKDLLDKNKQLLVKGQKQRRDFLINIELDNSYKFNSDNATNANGDSVWQIQDWNYITSTFSDLNNATLYPDYQSLIAQPHLSRFNIETNPIMRSNLYLNSLFDLNPNSENFGKRRINPNTKEPVQISAINYNGLKMTSTETASVGLTTTSLPKSDKFLQDLNSLLVSGIKEHIRYGDKSSSYGTLFKNFVTSNSFLPFHINTFSSPFVSNGEFSLPAKVLQYFKDTIIDELVTIHNSKNHKNILHYSNKSDKWQVFDGIKGFDELLTSFKESMDKEGFTQDLIPTLVNTKSKEIEKKLAIYFEGQYKTNEDSVKNTFDKINLPVDGKISQVLLKEHNIDTLLRAYTINNFVLNIEHAAIIAGDLRMYKSAGDVFKRLSAYSAPKTLSVVNDLVLRSIEKYYPRMLRPKFLDTYFPETDIVNVAIFKDVEIASELLSQYEEYFKEKNYSPEDISKILKAYTEMTEGDGQGWITLDEYRKFKIVQKKWSTEQENLYKKIANNEELTSEEISFFPPIKAQYGGQLFTEELNVPGFHKFSLVPLIPQAIKGTSFEAIHNNLLKQDIGYALFGSGNKASAILNSDNEFNDFYSDQKQRIPFEGKLQTQKVFYNYLGEQVNIEPEPKKKVTFSTQLRKLLFSNLFDNGIPIDYTQDTPWEQLTEEEKLKNSTYYKNKEKFRDILQKMYNYHLNKLLDDVGATYTQGKFYDIDQQKLSNLLTKEFQSRNLPDNAYKILATKPDGTFKYPLDSSIMRNTIESVLVSIVDNRLRKQKINGDALIQVASSGFELNNFKAKEYSNDLATYRKVERNGKIVTAAMQVKVAFNKQYYPLLKLKHIDGQPISNLTRLNEVIKDENWLNKDNNRDLLTLVGVRIPVQGLNSQEFMEIFHFLPEESSSVIIVPSEIVAKSGGDFDIDKLSIFRPNITEDGKLFKQVSEEQKVELLKKRKHLKNIFDSLTEKIISTDQVISDLEDEVETFLFNLFDAGDSIVVDTQKLLNKNKKYLDKIEKNSDKIWDEINEITSEVKSINLIKGLENELISLIKESLQDYNRFGELITPNGTYLFDKKKEVPISISDIFTHSENLKQFQANLVGKATLGIAAVHNTFFQLMQEAGMYLNPTYLKPVKDKLKEYPVRILLPHNTYNSNITLSKITSVAQQSISEVISQMMNGYVDVAKGAWIFDLGLVKEVASTALFLNQAGVSLKDIIALVNTPVIKAYVENKINSNSVFLRNFDPESQQQKTKKARLATYQQFGTVLDENKNLDEYILSDLKDVTNILSATPSQILSHYIELENLANLHTSLMRGLNGDTNKSSSIFDAEYSFYSFQELQSSNLYPKDKIDYIQEKSVISSFINKETGVKRLLPKLWKPVLSLSEARSINDFIIDNLLNLKELKTEYKFGNRDKLIKSFKNDLFLYIFQNYATDPETNNLFSSTLLPLFNTKTPNNIKERYTKFKEKYSNLFEENTFLNKLSYNLSKKSNIVNFELKVSKLDKASQNEFTEALEKLLDHPNKEVKQFAKFVIYAGFIQSGLSKSYLSYTSLIPNELYTSLISDAISQFTKFLKTKEAPVFLKNYTQKFIFNNPSFFLNLKSSNSEPTRLKNYIDISKPSIFVPNMEEDYQRITKEKQVISLPIPTTELTSQQSEVNTVEQNVNPRDFTNHSGGAIGSDTQWDVIGAEFGMTNNKHYWTETKTPKGNTEISKEDFEEGRFESAKAAKRNFGYQYSAMKDSRLIRNWSQVKHSDAVLAIGKIVKIGEKLFPNQTNDTRVATNPSVTGGTGYAVGMAINHNKPVYVFNQTKSSYEIGWYKWDNKSNDFVKVETPILTKNFAGIGTREINDLGKQAIRDVYEKTFKETKDVEQSKERIKKEYPTNIELETVVGTIPSIKLQEITNSIFNETDYVDIKKGENYSDTVYNLYGGAASRYVSDANSEIAKTEGNWLKSLGEKTAKSFIDDYLESELGEGKTIKEYAQALLDKNVKLIDTYQLDLFGQELKPKDVEVKPEITEEDKDWTKEDNNCNIPF